ncbi:hypothetical protein EYZ11_003302 [Aspergillus tanneri]|uniref:Uncharacterized protein n=1 Tax=Aspergillus tanneri TaxID=1220188 RepID=A0A4S3JNL1_9EURO|nr:hypothetical protein EYZ11_003302 [Aspergillus tanneri]
MTLEKHVATGVDLGKEKTGSYFKNIHDTGV